MMEQERLKNLRLYKEVIKVMDHRIKLEKESKRYMRE